MFSDNMSRNKMSRSKMCTNKCNIESGEGGPCLTDAAHEPLSVHPFANLCRYASVRTDAAAIIAALNPGGVMQSSGLAL